MLFLSQEFLLFFLTVFVLYWSVFKNSMNGQDSLLMVSSIIFYGWTDTRFLILIGISGTLNYGLAVLIEQNESDRLRSAWLWTGVILNILILGYFKYFGFFYESLACSLEGMGLPLEKRYFKIALPIGISFFTFQMIGYLIDVNNGSSVACRKPIKFFTYVLYFPKILAGPIERAQNFLPSIERVRTYEQEMISDGMRQFLWGAFAKTVIADGLSPLVDGIHTDPGAAPASTLWLGACLYLIQLYADFSGYSNMAIGTSKMLGIPLSINFRSPLFALNVSDFWRRWHVSLTSWMMDYLFTPLAFMLRQYGRPGASLAIMVTFLAVGVWHGANWTFIVFGLIQGLLFLPLVASGKVNVTRPGTGLVYGARQIAAGAFTFILMAASFVWMRADSIAVGSSYWKGMVGPGLWTNPSINLFNMLVPLLFFLLLEWLGRGQDHMLTKVGSLRTTILRWSIYAVILVQIALYSNTQGATFIYFAF